APPSLGRLRKIKNRAPPSLGRIRKIKNRAPPLLGRIRKIKNRAPPLLGRIRKIKNRAPPPLGRIRKTRKELVRKSTLAIKILYCFTFGFHKCLSNLTQPLSSNSTPSFRKSSSIKFGSPKCILPVNAPNLFT